MTSTNTLACINDEKDNNAWSEQERELISMIRGTIDYYTQVTRRTIKIQRIVSVTAMMVAAAAPVFVTASGLKQNLLGLPSEAVTAIALILTLFLSIFEGVRRIYRFERRWVSCHVAKTALQKALGRFRFATVDVSAGTPEWKEEMQKLRDAFELATDKETETFYQGIIALEPAEPKTPKK